MSIRAVSAVVMLCLSTACAEEPKRSMNRDTMTQRQKDSVLGTTRIPGASSIPKAQRATDSLNARARALDTIH